MDIKTHINYSGLPTLYTNIEINSEPRWYGWVGWSYKCGQFNQFTDYSVLPMSEHRFQEGDVVDYMDADSSQYPLQHEVHARATRLYAPPNQKIYKDLIGHSISVVARTEPKERGVSGLGITVKQMGKGIASNEFHAVNPADADDASTSMAGVQGVCKPQKASCDSEHVYRAVLGTTKGKTSTAAFMSRSAVDEHGDGSVMAGLDLSRSKVAPGGAGIKMPKSSKYSEGYVIEYEPGCYTVFDRFNKKYHFILDNKIVFTIGPNGPE